MAPTQTLAPTLSLAPIVNAGSSPLDLLLALCAMLSIALVVSIVLLVRCHLRLRRALALVHERHADAGPVALSQLAPPQYPASNRGTGTYDDYQYATCGERQPNTVEEMAPAQTRTVRGVSADYSQYPTYSEPCEFADAEIYGTPLRSGHEPTQMRLWREPSGNEPRRASDT